METNQDVYVEFCRKGIEKFRGGKIPRTQIETVEFVADMFSSFVPPAEEFAPDEPDVCQIARQRIMFELVRAVDCLAREKDCRYKN